MRQAQGFTFQDSLCTHGPPLVRVVNDRRGTARPPRLPGRRCHCTRPRLVIEVVEEPSDDLGSLSLGLVIEEEAWEGRSPLPIWFMEAFGSRARIRSGVRRR